MPLLLSSSPAVPIRSGPCKGADACILTRHLRREMMMAVKSSEARRGERVRATTWRSRTRATLPGIGAGVARGVNGLCPSIEWRARGGRARGDGRRTDGPGMLRRPTGSSASVEKAQEQEDKARAG